ncbi:MAG TPA: hypothetical protein VGJ00_00855, partial [Rhabdochlamydiaceae bacterium]
MTWAPGGLFLFWYPPSIPIIIINSPSLGAIFGTCLFKIVHTDFHSTSSNTSALDLLLSCRPKFIKNMTLQATIMNIVIIVSSRSR